MLLSLFSNFTKDLNRHSHNIDDNNLMNILKSPRLYDLSTGCNFLHGHNEVKSCQWATILTMTRLVRSTWKLFLVVHLTPILLYKRREFMENPLRVIKRLFIGFIKTNLFIMGKFLA